jgi:hypothetical protein
MHYSYESDHSGSSVSFAHRQPFYTLQHPYDISNFFDHIDSEDEGLEFDEGVIMIMKARVVHLRQEQAILVPVASNFKWHWPFSLWDTFMICLNRSIYRL